MRFTIYDTRGNPRDMMCDIDADMFRSFLSKFKTHCVIDKSAYEFNHFVNWMKQRGMEIVPYREQPESVRVDM